MASSSSSNIVEFHNQTLSISEFTDKVLSNNVDAVRLSHVQLQGTAQDMESLAKWLRGHPTLQEWSLSHVTVVQGDDNNDLTLDNVVACLLVSADDLQVLHLDHVTPKVDAAALSTLAHCPSLRVLAIPHCGYTDDDVTWISDALSSSCKQAQFQLETVDLRGNELSVTGAKALERCLEKNTTLRELLLEGNPFCAQKQDAEQRIHAKLTSRAALAA